VRKEYMAIVQGFVSNPGGFIDAPIGKDELTTGSLNAEQWRRLRLPYQALHASLVCVCWPGLPDTFRAPPEPWFASFLEAGEDRRPSNA
jgi:hypothetical protein